MCCVQEGDGYRTPPPKRLEALGSHADAFQVSTCTRSGSTARGSSFMHSTAA
jgi:hypothetical protein